MHYHYGSIIRRTLRSLLGADPGTVKPLVIPYESRNVERMVSHIREALMSIGKEWVLVALWDKGLRPTVYICEGKEVRVRVRSVEVADELSGLRHRIPVVEVIFTNKVGDACALKSLWKGSRAVIDNSLLEECASCRRIVL